MGPAVITQADPAEYLGHEDQRVRTDGLRATEFTMANRDREGGGQGGSGGGQKGGGDSRAVAEVSEGAVKAVAADSGAAKKSCE